MSQTLFSLKARNMRMGGFIVMILCVFEISLLVELRKFYFKPAGNMLFYDTALCPQFVLALRVAEHGTKRHWLCLFVFVFFYPS